MTAESFRSLGHTVEAKNWKMTILLPESMGKRQKSATFPLHLEFNFLQPTVGLAKAKEWKPQKCKVYKKSRFEADSGREADMTGPVHHQAFWFDCALPTPDT